MENWFLDEEKKNPQPHLFILQKPKFRSDISGELAHVFSEDSDNLSAAFQG